MKNSAASFAPNKHQPSSNFLSDNEKKPSVQPETLKFANRQIKQATDEAEGVKKERSKSISSRESSPSGEHNKRKMSRSNFKKLSPINTQCNKSIVLDPSSHQHVSLNFEQYGIKSSPTLDNRSKASRSKQL